jgi:hypothetical protein
MSNQFMHLVSKILAVSLCTPRVPFLLHLLHNSAHDSVAVDTTRRTRWGSTIPPRALAYLPITPPVSHPHMPIPCFTHILYAAPTTMKSSKSRAGKKAENG